MVDALRRARELLQRDGFVLDLHPTTEAPHLEVGSDRIGDLTAEDARERHAAADAALAAVFDQGLFVVGGTREFSFRRHAASLNELCEYVKSKWSDGIFEPATLQRAEMALRQQPKASLWLREQARATTLMPS